MLLLISLLIFSAKAGGLISMRIGQPAVLGELLAGLILGPSVLDVLSRSPFSDPVAGEFVLQLAELGVIFLMFIAGLEVHLDGLIRSGRVAILAGAFGVFLPLVFGSLAALLFHYSPEDSVFVGLILTATSVSISAQTLLDLDLLQRKEGLALLGAAVVDDVLGILLLSIFLALSQETGAASGALGVIAVAWHILAYIALALVFGLFAVPRLSNWVDRLPVSEGIVAFVIIVTLMYAWSAQIFGDIAAITGAFIAGTMFGRTHLRRVVADGMHTLTYAFFVPIFLISIGLRANARSIGIEGLGFTGVIILVAVLAKIAGCSLGARAGGFDTREALRVGMGMVSRGEVGLIIAAIGLSGGWIDQALYSTVVVMVLVTTLITPVLLRVAFPREQAQLAARPEPEPD